VLAILKTALLEVNFLIPIPKTNENLGGTHGKLKSLLLLILT
jgi:hypothetical protein